MRSVLMALVVLCLGISAADAAGKKCYRKSEAEADQAIRYTTQVMVMSDTCRDETYGRFALRNRTELLDYQHALMEHFRRSEGKRAQATLDSFMTRIANEKALETSTQNINSVCSVAVDFLATADKLTGEDFRKYVERQTADRHGDYEMCKN
jgi:hypothetical protein